MHFAERVAMAPARRNAQFCQAHQAFFTAEGSIPIDFHSAFDISQQGDMHPGPDAPVRSTLVQKPAPTCLCTLHIAVNEETNTSGLLLLLQDDVIRSIPCTCTHMTSIPASNSNAKSSSASAWGRVQNFHSSSSKIQL